MIAVYIVTKNMTAEMHSKGRDRSKRPEHRRAP
jgi:hypothetical protein